MKIEITTAMHEIDILEAFWNKNTSKFKYNYVALFHNKIALKRVKCKKEKSIRV